MASTIRHNQDDAARARLDLWVSRLLRVPEITTNADRSAEAQRAFSFAMVLSGLRCILSYLVFPILLPALGLGITASVGAVIGIPVGVLALFFDIRGIRRFWVANYRYKWHMTVIYLAVIGLVTYLVIQDFIRLIG
ncbi:MAG: hypothetical protein ACP5PJ_06330 [Acidimicrobiales bacterium]